MKQFHTFLLEAVASEDKLKHLEHAEDHPINAGAEGFEHAKKTLFAVSNAIQGKQSSASITTKYDGSPSIVFGRHPITGKFFVASKSAFNKTPKLNYTPEDVDANHGHVPGLADKLKIALKHLPKIAPDKGVYQGDVLHGGKGSVQSRGDEYHFKPNLITYTAKKNSPEGRKIGNAKFGLAVHTQYKGTDIESMKADFKPNLDRFKEHPDVHLVSTNIDPTKSHYDKKTIDDFEQHMADAEKHHQNLLKNNGYDSVQRHTDNLKTYINKTVRQGTKPSVEGYKQHVAERGQKDVDKLKTATGKAARQRAHELALSQIDKQRSHIQTALNLHHHLQQAKNTLVHALEPAVKGDFGTKINDQESKGEGSVVTIDGRPTKLVDREEFSRSNFAARPRPGDASEISSSTEGKHGVLVFGRMNPPTPGHVKVAEKAMELAKKVKGEHKIVVSHSQDPTKNPLTAEQKVKHAKRMFPKGANVVAASKEQPTILHHASEMHKSGIQHLHVVAGSDRVKEFQDMLDKYNGTESKHGFYNFKTIHVHSSGQRDPDAEGIEGISASKMRSLASSGNKKDFHAALPDNMDKKHKDEMYNDVRKGMNINEMFLILLSKLKSL